MTLFLEFYYMSNGLTFEIFNIILRFHYRCEDMTWKWPVQNFKEIGSELTDKSTKNMRYRFTKIIVSFCIVETLNVIKQQLKDRFE